MEKSKTFVWEKIKRNSNIMLTEGNNLITAEKSLAETFNDYFVRVVSNLDDNSGKGDGCF